MPRLAAPPTTVDLAERFALGVHRSAAAGADADPAVPVAGVTHDSRRVSPGDLYAALPGSRVHGARFAADAVAAGAVAVLTDAAGADLVAPPPDPPPVPVLLADDPRAVLGPVASAVHGDPSADLAVAGVTGTNGKTTVTWLVHHLLRSLGAASGLIGTVGVRVLDDEVPSSMTTPEAPDLQRLLADMRRCDVASVSMEVSSHALSLRRVDGTRMAVTAFTNLSRDHLDFHGDMDSYLEAKVRLFVGGFADRAVVCVDDEAGRTVAARARQAGVAVWTVGSGPEPGQGTGPGDADVTMHPVRTGVDGRQHVAVRGPFGAGGDPVALSLDVPMPGHHNAVNATLALALAHRLVGEAAVAVPGVDGPEAAATALAAAVAAFPGVPGRMERVVDPATAGRAPLVVVDYAHTPDAVRTALRSLRAATPGRLVVVLGAGGRRDPGKRGPMGASAADVADVVVVTDDNPRGEDPAAIRAAVIGGAVASPGRTAGDVAEVADRAAAIARALACCSGPDDTVLVTGKGHETGQAYVEAAPLPFDDRVAAAAALDEWSREAGLLPAAEPAPAC